MTLEKYPNAFALAIQYTEFKKKKKKKWNLPQAY